jgi:hypothetical protein
LTAELLRGSMQRRAETCGPIRPGQIAKRISLGMAAPGLRSVHSSTVGGSSGGRDAARHGLRGVCARMGGRVCAAGCARMEFKPDLGFLTIKRVEHSAQPVLTSDREHPVQDRATVPRHVYCEIPHPSRRHLPSGCQCSPGRKARVLGSKFS